MARIAMAQGTICTLRREIARIEGTLPERLSAPEDGGADAVLRRHGRPAPAALPCAGTGTPGLDAALGGGILQAALTEITGRETRDSGTVAGFALALAALAARNGGGRGGRAGRPVLWVSLADTAAEAGLPYAPGVEQFFGLPPSRLLLARTRRIEDALWAAEEAARLGGFRAVFLELRGNPARLDLTATRRLHNRARDAGQPVILIRHSAEPEPSAAPTRLCVSPAQSPLRETLAGPLPRSIGPPAFAVALAKSRTGRTGTFILEWNPHDFAFQERRPSGGQPARKGAGAPQDTGAVAALSFDGPDPAAAARGRLAQGRRAG